MIVRDTAAWIWRASDPERLSADARRALDAAERVLVSAISVWEVAMLVAKKGLSVRETEALVRRLSTRKEDIEDREPTRPDPNITRLEQNLTDKLGAKVQVQHGAKGRGKLVIAYNSLDELDGILAHIQ